MFNSQINRQGVKQSAAQTGLALGVGGAAARWAKDRDSALLRVGSELRLPDLKLLDAIVWGPPNVQQKTLVVYWWTSWCLFVQCIRPVQKPCGAPGRASGHKAGSYLQKAGICCLKILKV